jgi:methyl-accepting chemotaxis protein
LLIGLFAGGLLTFIAVSYGTLYLLKFNNPYYQRVLRGKDLLADVLPPPQHLIEAYLVVQQMALETESAALQRLIARSKALRVEYETRHAFWVNHLPEEPLKEMLTVKAYQLAMAFFTVRDNEFLPLVVQGDREKAQALARGVLQTYYQAHHAAIDEVVRRASEQVRADEQRANAVSTTKTVELMGVGLCILVLLSVSGWWLTRGIIRSLQQLMDLVQSAARENSG